MRTRTVTTLGWREWVALPHLGGLRLEAKLDTGARTSTLHATSIEAFERDGRTWVRFVTPGAAGPVEAPAVDHRDVRSSSGHSDRRYVIETQIVLAGDVVDVELTLTNRSRMRYPMLVGRTALAGRFAVDPARVHLAAGPEEPPARPGAGGSSGPSSPAPASTNVASRGRARSRSS
jgi:hypothetical protein